MRNQQPIKKRLNIIACLLSCGLLLEIAAGCATQNYDRGAQTSATINSAASQSANLDAEITASLNALSALEYQSQGDLRTHYVKFSDAVEKLKTGFHQLNDQITKAQSQANAYLKNWDRRSSAIQNQQIRSISNQQRQDISDKLLSVNNEYEETETAIKPFMGDLTGVRTYLGTDLTRSGLSAISKVVSKTKADAVPLRNSLQKLQAHLTSLGATMSPVISDAAK